MVFRKPVFASVIPRGSAIKCFPRLPLFARARECPVLYGWNGTIPASSHKCSFPSAQCPAVYQNPCLLLPRPECCFRFPVAPRGDCIGGAHGPESIAYPISQLLAQFPNIRVGDDYYRGTVVVSPVDDFKQAFPCPITGLFRKRKKRL